MESFLFLSTPHKTKNSFMDNFRLHYYIILDQLTVHGNSLQGGTSVITYLNQLDCNICEWFCTSEYHNSKYTLAHSHVCSVRSLVYKIRYSHFTFAEQNGYKQKLIFLNISHILLYPYSPNIVLSHIMSCLLGISFKLVFWFEF